MKRIFFFVLILFVSNFLFGQAKSSAKDPQIIFAGVAPNGHKVTCRQILNEPRLRDISGVYKVDGFSITILPRGKELIGPFDTKGASLNKLGIEAISMLQNTAGKVIIENIKATGSDGLTRSVASIALNFEQ